MASVDQTEARTRRLGTGVEPLLLKPRRDEPGDQVVPGCLERAGALWFCRRIPRIIGLPELSSFHDRPMTSRPTAPPGRSSARACHERRADSLEEDGRRPVRPYRLAVILGVRAGRAGCPGRLPAAAPSAARHAGPPGAAARSAPGRPGGLPRPRPGRSSAATTVSTSRSASGRRASASRRAW